jgi:DcmR-like sensory protein
MQTNIESARRPAFWREMGAGDHACQVYRDDDDLLDTLSGFIGGGLWSGESAIVIATDAHLVRLEDRLRQTGLDLAHFRADDRYMPQSAELTLAKFVQGGWPDAERFAEVLTPLVERARGNAREIRGFSEMVSVLWNGGHYAGAVRLEHLWNKLLEKELMRLLCAYSRTHFAKGSLDSRRAVQNAHTRIVHT